MGAHLKTGINRSCTKIAGWEHEQARIRLLLEQLDQKSECWVEFTKLTRILRVDRHSWVLRQFD